MEKEELLIQLGELGQLLQRISKEDVLGELKNEFDLLENKIKTSEDEDLLDIFRDEFNLLEKKIHDETEFEEK